MTHIKDAIVLFLTRQHRITLFFIFLLVLLFIQYNLFAQVESGSFEFEGFIRDYLVFLPQNYNSTAKMPVVLNLHGSGLDNLWTMDYTQMNTVADTAGFVVVYPNGIIRNYRQWFYDNNVEIINEVRFFSALIDTLDRKYSIDLERIYACGFSMGGWMSCKLACQLSRKITAIATIAGGIAEGVALNIDACHPVPVLSIHGTEDPAVPYETGRPDFHALSPEQTVRFWTDFNSCSYSDTTSIPDVDASDGCTVEKITYGNGVLNSRVIFYKVIGGGHT